MPGSFQCLKPGRLGCEAEGGVTPSSHRPPPSSTATAIIAEIIPIPREHGWDRDDPEKSHPLSWSFDLETPPTGGGREGKRKGGRVQLRGAWGHPGLRALPLPGPSAVGRGMEPRRPAGSGRRGALIRPRAIFAARRVRNPGLGRLLGRLGKLREGKSGRLGRRVARSRDAARLRPLRAASAVEGWGRAPRAADAAPEPTRPAPRAPRPPPRALTHRRRRHRGLGGPEGFGEGLPPPARGHPRRVPARPPGNAMERGACAPGAGPAGGGGRADSRLRNARGPPGPSHLLREGGGDTCGWGSKAPWSGREDLVAQLDRT